MKDYYASIRIQQGRLKWAMQQLGIKTAADLSRRCGVSQGTVGDMLNFKLSPRAANGEWRSVTLAVCKALGWEPSYLFPDHLNHEITTNQIAGFVEREQLTGDQALPLNPREEYDNAEMKQRINVALGYLTDRERRVLEARFWDGKTLHKIGSEEGVSGETVRVIESRAIRKLRHPQLLRQLQ